jgi:hypothetical protein
MAATNGTAAAEEEESSCRNQKRVHLASRIKNFIPAVRVGSTDQNLKAAAFTHAYNGLLGTVQNRTQSLNLEYLQLASFDLNGLETIFTDEDLPKDRAPGRDGFIGMFYQKTWSVIKQDIIWGRWQRIW